MSWMAWTLPSALFFVGIALLLLVMTCVELKWPTTTAKGFLPMATTRGDRVFISLLLAGMCHIAWLAFASSPPYPATLVSVLTAAVVLRWG